MIICSGFCACCWHVVLVQYVMSDENGTAVIRKVHTNAFCQKRSSSNEFKFELRSDKSYYLLLLLFENEIGLYIYKCFLWQCNVCIHCLHYILRMRIDSAYFFGVCLPIMKSHPVKSFHEKTHSSSFDESFDILEFSAILRKDIKKMDNNWDKI